MNHEKLDPPHAPEDHYLGPADAPIELVEYGDYECPQCGRAYVIVQKVLARLRGRLRFVYRNFPITDIHPLAGLAAEAAESVAARAGNGAFWDMHEMLFENQDALEIDDLLGYAEAAGAPAARVADDLSTCAMRGRVREDFKSGARSGVNGTPTFFVNGLRYDGDWEDEDGFIAALVEAAAATRR